MRFTHKGHTVVYSLGNLKLPRKTLIWSLQEIDTCPFSTTKCRSVCYATKASYRPNVSIARELNTEFVQDTSIKASIKQEVLEAMVMFNHHKIDQVRIHEAGDFYDINYLYLWVNVARAIPDKIFYTYTHSIPLVTQADNLNLGLPSNFIINASTDSATPPEYFQQALKLRKTGYIKHIFHIEDNPKVEQHICIQDCNKCNLCYNPKAGNVYITVKQH